MGISRQHAHSLPSHSHSHSMLQPRASSECHPKTSTLTALDGRLNEAYAEHAILDGGIEHLRLGRAPVAMGADGARHLGIDVGKPFEIAFRMPGGRARHACCLSRGPIAAARDPLLWLRV